MSERPDWGSYLNKISDYIKNAELDMAQRHCIFGAETDSLIWDGKAKRIIDKSLGRNLIECPIEVRANAAKEIEELKDNVDKVMKESFTFY